MEAKKITPVYHTTRTRRKVGTLTAAERKEYLRAYQIEYRAKQKALQGHKASAPVRFCRKCDAPTERGSYFFCHYHNLNTRKYNRE